MSIYSTVLIWRTTKKSSTGFPKPNSQNIPIVEGVEIENIRDVSELNGMPVAEVERIMD